MTQRFLWTFSIILILFIGSALAKEQVRQVAVPTNRSADRQDWKANCPDPAADRIVRVGIEFASRHLGSPNMFVDGDHDFRMYFDYADRNPDGTIVRRTQELIIECNPDSWDLSSGANQLGAVLYEALQHYIQPGFDQIIDNPKSQLSQNLRKMKKLVLESQWFYGNRAYVLAADEAETALEGHLGVAYTAVYFKGYASDDGSLNPDNEIHEKLNFHQGGDVVFETLNDFNGALNAKPKNPIAEEKARERARQEALKHPKPIGGHEHP